MTQVILNQIINQLQALELSELQQLSQVIQKYLQDCDASAKRAKFHRSLMESGLVRQIKHPNFERRSPKCLIQVQGEPVSTTIIGEH